MQMHHRVITIITRFIGVLGVIGLCISCTKTSHIPTPPPNFAQSNTHIIPTNLSQCPWDEINNQMINRNQLPTSFTVNCMLLKAMDPNIPPEQKMNLVSGKIDKNMFRQIGILEQQYPFFIFYARDPITKNPQGKYQVEIDIDLLGKLIPFQAELDYEHGRWKLSKNFTCGLISLISYNNPKEAQAAQLRCLS